MRKSYLLALVLLAAVSAWLYSGSVVIGGRADSEPSIAEAARNEDAATAVRVAVRRINVQTRSASLLLRGRTLAKDRVSVRAQVEGTVKDLPVAKGQAVRRGDLLCELDTRTRAAHLAQARAQLEQAEADYEAAAKLAENGYTARTRVRTLRAQRDAARAVVEAAAWELENTRILAPEDGIIETLDVRRGSLLRPGDICAGLVKVDPMLAVAHVSENELAGIEVGSPATVRPVTGGEFTGRISYIAAAADAATRTFRIEASLANPDGALRDGVTSVLDIPLPASRAHLLPGSALVLRDDGNVGVRAVDAGNKVVFHPVKIVADAPDGVWVAGLPDTLDLIVRGQDYVVEGASVEPVMETAEAAR